MNIIFLMKNEMIWTVANIISYLAVQGVRNYEYPHILHYMV